jgi:hypothetical protein
MMARNRNWWFLILVSVLVAACGGGDSSPPGTSSSSESLSLPHVKSPVADCLAASSPNGVSSSQGIEGTGRRSIKGTVTAVRENSLTVSDIVFDASHAVVFVNGVCATLADVRVGAIATVYGDFSDATHTGTAAAIYAEEAVVGGIDAIDGASGTMNVIGQSIVVTSATVLGDDIQPNQLSTLSVNDMVAVSGVMRPDSTLEATRIRRWQGEAFAVAGVVTTIDSRQQLLRVGGVTVRYTNAQLVNFPDATIRPGDYVRALGQNIVTVAGFENASGFDAWAIQRAVIPAPDLRTDIVLQGAINAVRASDDFDVMGQPVKMTSGTRSAGLAMDLTRWGPAGVFLTVFGSLDPSGYVIADLVVPQNGGGLDITGPITAIDRSAHTLAIMGVPIQLSSYCFLADESGQSISFDAFNIGDNLWVEGSGLSGGWIDCLIARQRPPSNEASVNGWDPGASHRPIIVLMGSIRADTTNATFFFGHLLGSGCSCRASTADEFWNYHHLMFVDVEIVGIWRGDHIDATNVYWLDE